MQPGLGYSPESISYLYIGEAEDEQGSTPWYKWNHDTNTAIPVHEDALTGVITNITVTNRPYKDKPAYKLHIHVQADRRYIIQAGAGTTFARGFLLAYRKYVEENPFPSGQLTIAVKKADEAKAVFSNLYDQNGRIMVDWDASSPLLPVVQEIQKKQGWIVQNQELIDDKTKYYEAKKAAEEKLKTVELPKTKRRAIKS